MIKNINSGKVLVCDIDGTISSIKKEGEDYRDVEPIYPVLNKIRQLKEEGWYIIFQTSRNMRTYDGNLEVIEKNTLPVIIDWLNKYQVPYDEIQIGKPWCGREGFYVDDKTIRPKEFLELPYNEILDLLERDKV